MIYKAENTIWPFTKKVCLYLHKWIEHQISFPIPLDVLRIQEEIDVKKSIKYRDYLPKAHSLQALLFFF